MYFQSHHEIHGQNSQAALGNDTDSNIKHIQAKAAIGFKRRIFQLNHALNRLPKTPWPYRDVEFFQGFHIRWF